MRSGDASSIASHYLKGPTWCCSALTRQLSQNGTRIAPGMMMRRCYCRASPDCHQEPLLFSRCYLHWIAPHHPLNPLTIFIYSRQSPKTGEDWQMYDQLVVPHLPRMFPHLPHLPYPAQPNGGGGRWLPQTKLYQDQRRRGRNIAADSAMKQ